MLLNPKTINRYIEQIYLTFRAQIRQILTNYVTEVMRASLYA